MKRKNRSNINALLPLRAEQDGRGNWAMWIDRETIYNVRLTAAGSAAGLYQFAEQQWNQTSQAWETKSGGVTHADLGEARERNATASLPTDSTSPVYVLRRSEYVSKTDGKFYWEFVVPAGTAGLFPVKVEKTGGANGTNTTAATYTYTVRSIAWNGTNGGTTLGTGVAVSRPRMNGAVTFQSGSTGYGIAFMDGNTLVLWDAGEKLNTAGCT